MVQIFKLSPLLFEFLGNHGIVLDDFTLEVLSVSESLLYFLLQAILILYLLATVSYKLLCEFFNLIDLLLELEDGLALSLDHLFKVITLDNKLRDSLLVVGLVPSADLDQDVEALVFQQGVGVLVLDFLNLLLNLGNSSFLLFDLLLVLQLTLIVVLDYLQLFQPFR